MTNVLRILIVLLLAAIVQPVKMAFSKERDFGRLAKEIESHFHAKRTRIPLFGVMKPAIRVVRPSGAKSLEIAIFEDQNFSETDDKEFAEIAGKTLGPEWHPLVQVVSRRDGEQTFIYVRAGAGEYRLIIATLEPNEAVVMEMKMNCEELLKLIDSPEEMSKAGKRISEEDGE